MPNVTIKSLDGHDFGGYLAVPPDGHGPGLIVIQEIFGVNGTMRGLCDGFAAEGYIALCPDLFWRQEPGVQLTDQTETDYARARTLLEKFDSETGVRDLLAALAHTRSLPGCSGKVGAVGYCLGGKLAWLMAARCDIECTVSYYGTGLETMLDETHDIRTPLLLHIAENDEFVSADARRKVLASIARNPDISAFTYPGAGHAFARPGGANFNAVTARLANERTKTFLADRLVTG